METFVAEDVAAFKQAFRRHAAGVAVVTARTADGTPVGFTATSLASLAAAPPLATFNMARAGSAWPAIESGEHVAISMLGARNRDLARRLSGPAEERFPAGTWHKGPHGLPLFDDVAAWMVGRIVGRFEVAANAIVAVQIDEGALGDDDAPLLYHERGYHAPRPLD